MSGNEILCSELCSKYGCAACKNRQNDEFLEQDRRFWCKKNKMVICVDVEAHTRCQHWAFNGSSDLIKGLKQLDLQGGDE